MLTITPEHEKLIQNHLDTEHQTWIEETRQQIAIGIAELDRGEGIDGATALAGYLQQFQAARQTRLYRICLLH
jgi:antitoxin ParD1/3/4